MSNETQLTTVPKAVVDQAEARVLELSQAGTLNLPENYSVGNAMRSAALLLPGIKDKAGRSVLEVCTRESIANALFSMAVQGLNPGKEQVYFIPYGDKLAAQRSYFGDITLAKRFCGVKTVHAQIVMKGDELETEIDYRGIEHVTKHVRTQAGRESGEILAAYCVVIFNEEENRERESTVMFWPEILKSWSMGQPNNNARKDFPGEMAKRTVIRRALKPILNSSDDAGLDFGESVTKAVVIADKQVQTREAAQHVIEEGDYFDAETGEVFEEEPVEAAFEPAQPAPAPAPVVVTEEERAGF